jgi:serine/threonine-protein kinase
VVICAATNPFGISWERDNTILFGQLEGIMRVSAAGGMPELVVRAENGEQIYGPQMLPDGASVLFSVTRVTSTTRWDQANIVVQSLRTGQRTVVLKGGSDARYVPTGHLVYALGNDLFAVAFDANRREVKGGPASVIEGVMRAVPANLTTAAANYGISNQGTLVYATGGAGALIQRTLVWVDRTGQEELIPAPTRAYSYPRVSPDGTRVALVIRDQEDDIWIWDLMRQTLTRLTFDPSPDSYPVWSPDSRRLIFASARSGQTNLYWQTADGTGAPERLTDSRNFQYPHTITPDGTEIVLREGLTNVPGGQSDLMRLPMGSQQRSRSQEVSNTQTLFQTRFNEVNAEISPDGRWMAYQSNESGRDEIYVRPFPDVASGRWQVSTSGGRTPAWARKGDELFYLADGGTIMGVRVEGSSSWRSSTPTKALQGTAYYLPVAGAGEAGRTFDVAADGKRFLMIKPGSGEAAPPPQSLIVVENWLEELKRLVPTK